MSALPFITVFFIKQYSENSGLLCLIKDMGMLIDNADKCFHTLQATLSTNCLDMDIYNHY